MLFKSSVISLSKRLSINLNNNAADEVFLHTVDT